MSTFKSDQRTNETAVPPVSIKPYEREGRVRVASWTYTTPASSAPGTSDTVELVRLPAGAKILGGKTACEALSSAGGTAGVSIGYTGATTRYASSMDLDAAGEDVFANTIALNYGDVLTAEKVIIATPTGETWAVDSKFYGHILYAID